jgi:hypothetical protein
MTALPGHLIVGDAAAAVMRHLLDGQARSKVVISLAPPSEHMEASRRPQ